MWVDSHAPQDLFVLVRAGLLGVEPEFAQKIQV